MAEQALKFIDITGFSLEKVEKWTRKSYTGATMPLYGHPFLRMKVDYLNLRALALIKDHFGDAGCKFHKMVTMTHAPFTAFRAPIYAYDVKYLNDHAANLKKFCP